MKEFVCKFCSVKFKAYKYRKNEAQYCSRACKGKDWSILSLGENNPCWRGGKPNCIK